MKKNVLIFLLVIVGLYSNAQQINTTDPFLYVEKVVYVGDTLKAIERAKQLNKENAEAYEAEKAPYVEVVHRIDSLLNGVKSVKKDPACMQLLVDACAYNHFLHVNPDIEKGVKSGKISLCYGILREYREYQKEQLEKIENKGQATVSWDQCIELNKTKQVFKEKNKNYRGYLPYRLDIDMPSIHAGWEWIFNEENEKRTEKYPINGDYLYYSSHPMYRVVDMNSHAYATSAYDNQGRLVAIAGFSYYMLDKFENIEEELLRQLCVKDYLNNKYDIRSRGRDTQLTIKNKLRIKEEKDVESLSIYANIIVSGLKADAATRQKNKKAYREARANLEHSLMTMMEYSSHYFDEDGNNYVEQLMLDNKKNLYLYKVERVDDTTFLFSYINSETHEPTAGALIMFSPSDRPYVFTCDVQLTKPADNLEKVIDIPEEIQTQTYRTVIKEEPITNEDKVFDIVEQMPSFPGGQNEMMKYISSHIVYPVESREKEIQGRVIVGFVVEKDGTISDAKIVKSVDPLLDSEALRLVMNMPKWKPGKQNGKNVSVKFNIPVSFRL